MRTATSVTLITAVLFFGTLFWAAVGMFLLASKEAASTLTTRATSSKTWLYADVAETREPTPVATLVVLVSRSTDEPATPAPAATPRPEPTPTAAPATPTSPPRTPTPVATKAGRIPWVLMPQPAPNSQVKAGPITVEARGRGDAPIKEIRLELDGKPLATVLEERGESTWRGHTTVTLTPGRHALRAVVVDAEGRTGAFRWGVEATP